MLKSPETYQGKQVIINSDRLIFNAREDSLFSSNKTIAFSTNKDFHINTSEGSDGKFAVNSPKIHLYSSVLPLLNQITLFPGLPTVPSPTNISIIAPLISDLNALKAKVKSIKSSNVYIK